MVVLHSRSTKTKNIFHIDSVIWSCCRTDGTFWSGSWHLSTVESGHLVPTTYPTLLERSLWCSITSVYVKEYWVWGWVLYTFSICGSWSLMPVSPYVNVWRSAYRTATVHPFWTLAISSSLPRPIVLKCRDILLSLISASSSSKWWSVMELVISPRKHQWRMGW